MCGALAAIGCGAAPDGEELGDLDGPADEEIGQADSELVAPWIVSTVPPVGQLAAVGIDRGGGYAYLGFNPALTPGGCTQNNTQRDLLGRSHLSVGGGHYTILKTTRCDTQALSPVSDGNFVYYIRDVAGVRTVRRAKWSAPHTDTHVSSIANVNTLSATPLGANIFAVAPNGVFRAPSAGGTAIQLATAASGTAFTFAAHDAAHVYYFETTAIGAVSLKRVPVGGGPSEQLPAVTWGNAVRAVTQDASNVYWFEGPALPVGGGVIRRMSKSSPSTAPTFVTVGPNDTATALGVNSTRLFWVLQTPGPNFAVNAPTKIQSATLTNPVVLDELTGLQGAGHLGGMHGNLWVGNSILEWHSGGASTITMAQFAP
ncbi:MAG: hypothetical protein FJ104_00185 [Deltaproteobacteria bacterium]|nr:hypothetical protein [Deltaproteobacteria bacterium]